MCENDQLWGYGVHVSWTDAGARPYPSYCRHDEYPVVYPDHRVCHADYGSCA